MVLITELLSLCFVPSAYPHLWLSKPLASGHPGTPCLPQDSQFLGLPNPWAISRAPWVPPTALPFQASRPWGVSLNSHSVARQPACKSKCPESPWPCARVRGCGEPSPPYWMVERLLVDSAWTALSAGTGGRLAQHEHAAGVAATFPGRPPSPLAHAAPAPRPESPRPVPPPVPVLECRVTSPFPSSSHQGWRKPQDVME